MQILLKSMLIAWFNLLIYSTLVANTVWVANHGAIPNDGIDDTQAIKNAIAACSKQGATLNFAAGNYNISGATPNDQGGGGNIFALNSYNNLIIKGINTRLVGTNWATVFRFTRCNNITVDGFRIDWQMNHLPFTPGKVTAINGNYFDLKIHPPFTFKPGLPAEVYADYDSLRTRYLEGGNRYRETVVTPDCTSPSPGIMRCYSNKINQVTVGNHAIVQHTKHAGNGFVLAEGNQIVLKNITIYSVPGLAVAVSGTKDVSLENFHVQLKTTVDNWWISSAAGATNYSNPRGVIRFVNVTLQGMGDDGANLHSRLMRITEVVNSTTIKVVDHWLGGIMPLLMLPKPGDVLEFGQSNTPFDYFTSHTTDTAYNAGGLTYIEMSSNTSNLSVGDIISNVSGLPTEALFDNCTVGKNRGRAFLISCDNVTIQNCHLEDISGPAILAHAEASHFMDAKPPQNLTIRDNTIKNCNFGSPLGEAMIEIAVRNDNNVLGSTGLIKNLVLEGNSFESEHGADGIFIGSSNQVQLQNNTFDNQIADRVIYENIGCNISVNEWYPTNSSPYLGTPHAIPGRIQAEDYDLGGETVAFHDRTAVQSTVYRSDQVGLRQVGGAILLQSTACREWTKYSVSVAQSGLYDLVFHMIPFTTSGKFKLIINEADTLGNISIPASNGTGNPSTVTVPNVFLNTSVNSIRFFVASGGFNFDFVDINLVQACLDFKVSVALEGAYNTTTGLMSDQLNQFGLLPGQTPTSPVGVPTPIGQPFSIAPWNYNGTEGQYFGSASYPPETVDWVLVSLRSSPQKSDELMQLAGLLNRDGSVDLVRSCPLPVGSLNEAYVVIEHRDHMAVMSAAPIPVLSDALFHDFRLQDSWKTAASTGQKEIVPGVWSMVAGDCEQVLDVNGYDIKGSDRILFNVENGTFYQYLKADFNLDGTTDGADKIFWETNNGLFSQVPR